jgi:taspase (threonine aspartase 1)
MDGDGRFGAVAAAPGIRNPIAAAALLASEGRAPLSHCRVRPMMLAGSGATAWALAKGLEAAGSAEDASTMHVVERAKKQWRKYSAMVEGGRAGPADGEAAAHRGKRRRSGGSSPRPEVVPDFNDTVGAVVVDSQGRVAAGVSSGGILLKVPGRVGEAAVFGAGCWAQDAVGRGEVGVACSVTGVGERIMQGLVARECAARAAAAVGAAGRPAPASAACEGVLRGTVLAGPEPRECGVLCVAARRRQRAGGGGGGGAAADVEVEVELAAVHCVSRSLAVAYMAQGGEAGGGARTAHAAVLRRGAVQAEGRMQALTFGASWPAPGGQHTGQQCCDI